MNNFNISAYLEEAKNIESLFKKFIILCSTERGYDNYENLINFVVLTSAAKPVQREILKKYETWFAVCKLITRQYSDRNETFEDAYGKVKSSILIEKRKTKSSLENNFIDDFDAQVNILHTILPIISLKETNFKKSITGDLISSELEQAEALFELKFHRAAGAIAGVVLERYLKTLCEVNQISVEHNDTIEPLATKLYKNDKIPDFDLTLFKSIQHLASIRNKCTHPKDPKEEIKENEVRELIDKTKKITFLAL